MALEDSALFSKIFQCTTILLWICHSFNEQIFVFTPTMCKTWYSCTWKEVCDRSHGMACSGSHTVEVTITTELTVLLLKFWCMLWEKSMWFWYQKSRLTSYLPHFSRWVILENHLPSLSSSVFIYNDCSVQRQLRVNA